MSRIGKKPIYFPEGVTITFADHMVTVKGPKGELTRTIHEDATIEEQRDEDGKSYVEVTMANPAEQSALWGTNRAHIANMVKGVTEGWSKTLELSGVGFRMNLQGKKLVMGLGFSHDVEYQIPEGIDASVENGSLTISGADKEVVGKVTAEIRALKKPEPYKGKGFRYSDEIIRRKAGKAAKAE